MVRCPVCDGAEVVDTVERECLPTMQNRVHRTRADALAAPSGTLTLAVCPTCGFAWNRRFEAGLVTYDGAYDNAVPSSVMEEYRLKLAEYLGERYDLEGRLILEVGCGDGAFLNTICTVVPEARGLGIDPALDRDRNEAGGRVRLVRGVLGTVAIEEPPALVACRHVLEHVPRPVEFLAEVRAAAGPAGTPCFLEVPDLDWSVEQGAYWDFCYEHCSYFGAASLDEALRRAGFDPVAGRVGYGGQYHWAEARTRNAAMPPPPVPGSGEPTVSRLRAYAASEQAQLAAARTRLAEWRRDGTAVAVWGMATKGVLFVVLTDSEASSIDACVDVNPNKHDTFVPLTGHAVRAPEALLELAGRPLAVLAMNPNYADEIGRACAELGLDATVFAAADLVS